MEKVTDKTDLPDSIRAEVLRLKKAKEELKKAKNDAGMSNDDKDVKEGPGNDLIPLDALVDIAKIAAEIKEKFKSDETTDYTKQSSKKPNLQLLLGLPYKGGLNYGPVITSLP